MPPAATPGDPVVRGERPRRRPAAWSTAAVRLSRGLVRGRADRQASGGIPRSCAAPHGRRGDGNRHCGGRGGPEPAHEHDGVRCSPPPPVARPRAGPRSCAPRSDPRRTSATRPPARPPPTSVRSATVDRRPGRGRGAAASRGRARVPTFPVAPRESRDGRPRPSARRPPGASAGGTPRPRP